MRPSRVHSRPPRRPGTARRVAIAVAVALGASLLPTVALADHDDGVYEIPSDAEYADMKFDVVIVPPAHGQLYNFEKGALGGGDPNEATPFNSYLKAIEAVIDEWDRGVATFGSDDLKAGYATNVYVVGRDTIPPAVLSDLEILVFADETEGPILGTAYHLNPIRMGGSHVGTCVVRSSMWWLVSYTYADMYNVMGQEFGHCLGLGHVGSQGGIDPTSDLKHPEHDMMNGFYTHDVGFAGNHQHCVSNLDVAGLEWNFNNPVGRRGISYMPVEYYGTTCEPPASYPPAPSPSPTNASSPQPEPSPSQSPSESPSPSPQPSESPAQPAEHERSISLRLRRHLVAKGRVGAASGESSCTEGVPVELVRKRAGTWRVVGTATTTSEGRFRARIPDRPGTYAARAPEVESGDGRCLTAMSRRVRHSH